VKRSGTFHTKKRKLRGVLTSWGLVETLLILSGSDQLGAGRDGSEKTALPRFAWWVMGEACGVRPHLC